MLNICNNQRPFSIDPEFQSLWANTGYETTSNYSLVSLGCNLGWRAADFSQTSFFNALEKKYEYFVQISCFFTDIL